MNRESVLKEVKAQLRTTGKWAAIGAVAFILFIGAAGTVAFLAITRFSAGAQPPTSLTDPRVPASAHGYSTLQVLDCLREGHDCPNFDKSKEFLDKSTASTGGITYTVLNEDGSLGEKKTMNPGGGAEDSVYQNFAVEVSGDGLASARTVFETAFTEQGEGQAVTFSVPTKDGKPSGVTGRMQFTPLDDVMAVQSIDYTKEGK